MTSAASTERGVAPQSRRASIAASLGAGVGVALGGLLAAAMILASLPALDAGTITGATVAVFGFLGLAGAESVSGLAESFAKVGDAIGGARRVLALATEAADAVGVPTSSEPPATPEVSPPAHSTNHPSVPAPSGTSVLRIPTSGAKVSGSPGIVLDDVVVSYADDRPPALDHLTLHLDPGQHLALVGPGGAGKTTLGYLLVGFVQPSHGTVTLDGLDLCQLDPEALQRLVAWAPQDPHVFHTSVAANLRLARPDAAENELADLLDRVGLGPWLANLPRGLSTTLGERGTTISGGERQRLGVARALLSDRPVLLLDEPTAHLDGAACLPNSNLSSLLRRQEAWIAAARPAPPVLHPRARRGPPPSFRLLENVCALTYHNKASCPAFLRLLQEVDDAGYHCLWRVLNAADHGVPQLRPRLFVVGTPKGTPLPDLPEPSHSGQWQRRTSGGAGSRT